MFHEPDPDTLLGRIALRSRRVPPLVRVPFILASLGAAGLCVVADLGPYRVIADAQAAIFDGEHYLAVSLLVTLLVCILPAAIAIQLLAGLFPDRGPPAPQSPQVPFPPGHNPYQGGPYWQGPQHPGPSPQGPPWQGPHGHGPGGQGPSGH